jgi:hypothetical protein
MRRLNFGGVNAYGFQSELFDKYTKSSLASTVDQHGINLGVAIEIDQGRLKALLEETVLVFAGCHRTVVGGIDVQLCCPVRTHVALEAVLARSAAGRTAPSDVLAAALLVAVEYHYLLNHSRTSEDSLEEEARATTEDVVLAKLGGTDVEAVAAAVLKDRHSNATGISDHAAGRDVDTGGHDVGSGSLGRHAEGQASEGCGGDEDVGEQHGQEVTSLDCGSECGLDCVLKRGIESVNQVPIEKSSRCEVLTLRKCSAQLL